MNVVYNMDCMEGMKQYADNHFELAIVDPPYGIDMANKFQKIKRWSGDDYTKELKKSNWDIFPPDKDYFNELFRISTNQIIWGGNYFIEYLYSTPCIISWNKSPRGTFTADCEIAWTSFSTKSLLVVMYNTIFGNNKYFEKRIHPTQKPVALYKWLLQNYAKPSDKILDTHVGSGGSRIACHEMGFDFIGYEIDKDYWQAQEDRFYHATRQKNLFDNEKKTIQNS